MIDPATCNFPRWGRQGCNIFLEDVRQICCSGIAASTISSAQARECLIVHETWPLRNMSQCLLACRKRQLMDALEERGLALHGTWPHLAQRLRQAVLQELGAAVCARLTSCQSS